MIYAIRCGKYIKFGKATDVANRLAGLQTGNPYSLHLLAQADWPDEAEGLIHAYLKPLHHRGEWFKDLIQTRSIIALMGDKVEGWIRWRTMAVAGRLYKGWTPPEVAGDRVSLARAQEAEEASPRRLLRDPRWVDAAQRIAINAANAQQRTINDLASAKSQDSSIIVQDMSASG